MDSRNYRTTNLTLFLNILWNKCSLSTYEKRKVMTAWKQHRFPKDKLLKTHRVCVCVFIILVSKYLDFSKAFDKMLYNNLAQLFFFFFLVQTAKLWVLTETLQESLNSSFYTKANQSLVPSSHHHLNQSNSGSIYIYLFEHILFE